MEAPFFSALDRFAALVQYVQHILAATAVPDREDRQKLSFFCWAAGAGSGKSSPAGQRQRSLSGVLFSTRDNRADAAGPAPSSTDTKEKTCEKQ